MGREVKRVPVDFDWPQGKTWEGYLRPERLRAETCSDCSGDGYTPEAQAVANTFYPHQISWPNSKLGERLAWNNKIGQAEVDNLIEHGRLRTWVAGQDGDRGHWGSLPRTAAEVNANQRGIDGHDAINRMILIEFRCERLGIPLRCATCAGDGEIEKYEGQSVEAEAWEPTDPPEGEGWQMWETTSEGSPMSPVFATADDLAAWLAETGASLFGDNTATKADWLSIITGADFAHVEIAPGVIMM